jgi:transposase
MVVLAHVGSARNENEISALKDKAAAWIKANHPQKSLFPKNDASLKSISLDKCEYMGIRYRFIYEALSKVLAGFNFDSLPGLRKMMLDLAVIRIIEPASKLRSLELLDEYFGLSYDRMEFYRHAKQFTALKDQIEIKILDFAKKELSFDFSVVFYDVTTLYFESFKSDDLRKPGFSKDNKSQQPQILIGLIVNSLGFPVAYDIFDGSKFEGHTIIPTITAFKEKHRIDSLTVVADAAMISLENVKALEANNLSYIVGARLGNLSKKTISEISAQLDRRDQANCRIAAPAGSLICDFSLKRYRKDKSDMEKHLKKAEALMKSSSVVKRAKFIRNKDKAEYELNEGLIEKTRSLLGIKGYYTNLPEQTASAEIISQYRNLWKIEKAFRISKNDLEIRPIYHFKEHSIKAHILICFISLAVCKYMEIQTGQSTERLVRTLKGVTDAIMLDTVTGKEIIMRSRISDEVKIILTKLNLSY